MSTHAPVENTELALFAAPGQVIVTEAAIRLRTAPAANRSERRAIDACSPPPTSADRPCTAIE